MFSRSCISEKFRRYRDLKAFASGSSDDLQIAHRGRRAHCPADGGTRGMTDQTKSPGDCDPEARQVSSSADRCDRPSKEAEHHQDGSPTTRPDQRFSKPDQPRCKHCGDIIPPGDRRPREYCSGAHRKAAARMRCAGPEALPSGRPKITRLRPNPPKATAKTPTKSMVE